MSRYIDLDKIPFVIGIDAQTDEEIMLVTKKQIDELPTADVVEVVRCKDCKFWGIPHANDIEKSHYCCRDNMWCMPLRFADDYCSYGEREEK